MRQLTVIGVGLIGGSLARALRRAAVVDQIVGCQPDSAGLVRAQQLGVIDRYATDVASAVAGADLVVLAVPLGALPELFRQLAVAVPPQAVITDVGSAKGSVVSAARQALGERIASFVPGHPIAGTEHSGVEASFAELFANHSVMLTPLPETAAAALQTVQQMWRSTGAQLVQTTVEQHDAALAATSHLPHLLAYTLVDTLGRIDPTAEIFRYAAGGFRDVSRVASSDPVMWRDICLANRAAIQAVLAAYSGRLSALQALIEHEDGAGLQQLFAGAKQLRDRHIVGLKGEE
ncbi:MAG: prephenate dehydrogenase/arogenate dehydrogenase family protein [Gammaproteobacteria bacterium]|nr:prephenate dehydrogenase/arogenate dehydrogenase family protein [Gammaproteobacteria bacterium]